MKTLILLLLMTSVCWGDEPEIIYTHENKFNTIVASSGPPDCFVFGNDNGRLCGLSKGKINFTGNAEDSAKMFFDYVIKYYIQHKYDKEMKISCPDGYKLEGKLFNRNGVTRIGKFDSNQTDAELKCVKNN